MCQALALTRSVVEKWLAQHPNCFPPIIINITDGEATDGIPTTNADEVRRLKSNDGEVLLFNLHVSSQRIPAIEYPNSDGALPDQFAKQLFQMSSTLPEYMSNIARQQGMSAGEGSRGFVFNADMVAVIKFLDIGTRPSALR